MCGGVRRRERLETRSHKQRGQGGEGLTHFVLLHATSAGAWVEKSLSDLMNKWENCRTRKWIKINEKQTTAAGTIHELLWHRLINSPPPHQCCIQIVNNDFELQNLASCCEWIGNDRSAIGGEGIGEFRMCPTFFSSNIQNQFRAEYLCAAWRVLMLINRNYWNSFINLVSEPENVSDVRDEFVVIPNAWALEYF